MRYAATATAPRVGISWIGAVYLIIGGIVAATHHYWSHLHTLKAWGSALLGDGAVAADPARRESAHSLAAEAPCRRTPLARRGSARPPRMPMVT